MSLDPVIYQSFQFFLAIVFLYGGAEKLLSVDKFESVLIGYKVLPISTVRFFAIALPVAEVLIGLMLGADYQLELGVLGAIAVLVAVTSAVVINLRRGNLDINCGCGGLSGNTKISWAIPVRNSILLAVTLSLLMSETVRVFTVLDAFITVGFVVALTGMYVVVNQLISNFPLLNTLRRVK